MTKVNYHKLELTWIGKGDNPKLEPRILIENPEFSYGNDKSENMLIYGDNLLALKALEQDFAGKIKCIYIDPPYNTGSRINADGIEVGYDDGIEHSEWLSMMKPRLELLYRLLSHDGTLAVQIDDNEFARLYLLLDEVFKGSKNLKVICVKMSEATGPKMAHVLKSGLIPKLKEYIIICQKNNIKNLWIERIPKGKWDLEYKTVIKDINQVDLEFVKSVLENEDRNSDDVNKAEKLIESATFENASSVCLRETGNILNDFWLFENAYRIVQFATLTGGARDLAVSKKLAYQNVPGSFIIKTPQKKAYAIKGDFNHETALPRCKLLFADKYLTVHPGDFWQDIKTTGLDNEGGVTFKKGKKPETLLKRIIKMSTSEGDFVLDSFMGSGTTAAVAHKLKRKWIGIEMGPHFYSHSFPRLKNVIDGIDQQGISEEVGWKGGGGFKSYILAPSLLNEDKYGNWVISKEYNAQMLGAAMAKQEGFKFEPDQQVYWKQGKSTEKDYIYTTTQFITVELLDNIKGEMLPEESLLIACKSFQEGCENRHSNISIKKMPQLLLGRCEFGKEDYSFNIVNLPVDDDTENEEIEEAENTDALTKKKKSNQSSPELFD